MKKALIIAYYFPPSAGGGVQRTLKFVRYLPSYDWQPVVLTVKKPDFDYFDESLLADLPAEAVVRRTFSINLWRYYRIRKYGKKSLYEADKKDKGTDNQTLKPLWMNWGLLKNILNCVLFVPDEYNGWFPFALLEGLRVIQKEKINLIYATGNPWTSFVIARYLSALTKIPFVIDFRDPWVLSPYTNTKDRKGVKYWISKKIEYLCVKTASCVINVNENITNIFKKYYKSENKAKFITITQGFDSNDFVGIGVRKNKKFTISHVGTFYSNRIPDKLLKAVNFIFQSHPSLRNKIEIRFVGITGSFAEESIKADNLSDVVKVIPYCSHRESIAEMCNSDLLVLIQANVRGWKAETSTGKLFEYLASGREILALVSEKNQAAQIIRNMDAGVAINSDNIKVIANTILESYKRWEEGDHNIRPIKNLSIYERKNLTGILARKFDHIIERNKIK